MKRIYKHILFALSTIVFISCSSNKEQEMDAFIDIHPMLATPLKGELMEEFLMTPYTKSMKFIQSRLFHFTPIHGESALITNEHADTIGYLPAIGNGPGEFVSSWPDYVGHSEKKDTLYMYDNSMRVVRKYYLQFEAGNVRATFVQKEKLKQKERPNQYILDWGINRLKRLDNGFYVGFCDLATRYTFALFDANLNEIKKFGEYPIKHVLTEGNLHFIPCFDGSLEIRGNSIFHAVRDFAYMARYDVDDDGNIKEVWRNFYSKTKCRESENSLIFKADNIQGFYSLAIGEKYIYAAYSGVQSGELHRQRSGMALYPRTLVVFDWDGNPLKKFQLEGRFVPICLDENEEYLYVQHDDPDTSLWRYKISEMLKHL